MIIVVIPYGIRYGDCVFNLQGSVKAAFVAY